MNNFRISPFSEGKSKHKRKFLSWLWLLIAIETLASGLWIFRLQQKIDYLESQISAQNIGEEPCIAQDF